MSHLLLVCVPSLTETQRAAIREAALRCGLEPFFTDTPEAALPRAAEIEAAFCDSPVISRAAANLRWQCTPSAGINQFTAPDAFLNPDAVLTNSSGAYGVTIAEHIIMVTL